MKRTLITGATGNIGFEIIYYLSRSNTRSEIIAGVRNINKARELFADFSMLKYVHFDFENFETFDQALSGVDRVFLLRPPHISDIDKYFKPLILKIKEKNIKQILFLSVQGAEKSTVIPNHKIEQLIIENKIDYIFLRPSYFMQNLTTTLLRDISTKREIVLPAGKAKFNWIDVKNIGEAGAILLDKFEEYKNDAYELTGLENENFEKVTDLINESITGSIKYRNVNPFKFYRIKRQEGMPKGRAIIMILLHFLPRFNKEPKISDFYECLTGKKPTDLKTFIGREKKQFEN